MTALYIILGIVLFFFLVGQIRAGVQAEYDETGLSAKLRVACFRFTLYPKPEGKEKKPRKKKKKEEPGQTEGETESAGKKKGGAVGLLLDLLPTGLEAVGALFRKIRMDILVLRLTWAAEDPAAAAMGYGAANAVMGAIYHPLERAFHIRKTDIDITVDYDRTEPVIYGRAALTLTVGQLAALVTRYGYRALRIWLGRRKQGQDQNTKKEATAHE